MGILYFYPRSSVSAWRTRLLCFVCTEVIRWFGEKVKTERTISFHGAPQNGSVHIVEPPSLYYSSGKAAF